MPVFRLSSELSFPDVELAEPEGLLALGGDLTLPRLLLAYSLGIFPWFSDQDPLLWWAPPQRAIVEPMHVHLPRSLRKLLRKNLFTVKCDTQFEVVIKACASTPRKQEGTWITQAMQTAYNHLHHEGFAHSFEVFLDNVLVGGLYGVSLGRSFFGESMFSLVDNSSKIAFAFLSRTLAQWQFEFIDCQLMNENVARYGSKLIERKEFTSLLQQSLRHPTRRGRWVLPDFTNDW